MINIRRLIRYILHQVTYLWIDVILVRETPKAILIIFDGRKAWITKSWVRHIKRKKAPFVIARRPEADEAISIKISDYHWAKKFA